MVTMGTWRGLRVAFIVGSLVMILLIVVYWGDVRGFNLYPKKEPLDSDPRPRIRPAPLPSRSVSASVARPRPLLILPNATPATPPHPSEQEEARPAETRRDGEKTGKTQKKERNQEEEKKERKRPDNREQEDRKKIIADVCSGKESVEFPGKNQKFDQIPDGELDHLIVDDTHKIIYCYVPKVACTNWKRVMVVLTRSLISPSGEAYTDPAEVPGDLVHSPAVHLTFDKFLVLYGSQSRQQMALRLQHYTKFLFVRDPFVRLISAFRNKFGKPNEPFYHQYGAEILSLYGNVSGAVPKTAAEAFAAGIKPTFLQFITYLLEREQTLDEHWRQVYRMCYPCQIQYDFIGKLESLETDSEQLLRILGVDHLMRLPISTKNVTNTTWESDWYGQIPKNMRRKLYKMYEPDFKLFGYPKPDNLLDE